jgi:hypothetical protein
LLVFVWLTPEQDSVWLVATLGLGGAFVTAAHLRLRIKLWLLFWGAFVGAGGAIAAAGLMFLKTALHAHPFPDFSPLLMLAMIQRAPAWGLAGALVGAGLLLLRNVFPRISKAAPLHQQDRDTA